MKIQTQLSNISDEISLSGSIFTINGKDYDLSNPEVLPQIGGDEENPIFETCENQRVYLSGEDTIIFLHVDEKLQFLTINHNLMRFFDIDDNNIIDVNELKIFVDHWNLPEVERRTLRDGIISDYLAIEGNTKESWKLKGVPVAV